MPTVGEAVEYHSPYRIGIFDAKIVRVNDDGTVAVNIFVNGLGGANARRPDDFIHLRSVSYGPEGRARPRL